MGVALLIVFGIVAGIGLLMALARREPISLLWLWFLPFLLTSGAAVLARPGPMRIYTGGVAASLPSWKRLLGRDDFIPYSSLVNVFPKPYYVAGATLSPFAAAVGTVEHVGIGLETMDGRRLVLRFTPSLPGFVKGESEGYRLALGHLREALASLGRPMVTQRPSYTAQEVESMKREALRPLMAFPFITAAFFSPLAILPLGYILLQVLDLTLQPLALSSLLALSILPIAAMIYVTWRRSVRRHHLLDEISKAEAPG
jgi:hypothetical protein